MKSYDSYKPSGVDWLGDIPEHWEVKRLKFVAKVQSSNVDKKSFADEIPVRLCNYVDVYKHEFIDDSISFMNATATEAEVEKFILNEGDVLITKDSETPDDIANPAFVVKDFQSVICGYHLAQIKPNKIELSGKYLFRLFQSPKFNSYFEVSANGITRFGLPLDSITDVFVSLPPLDEQRIIGDYLDEKTAQIDSLINHKLRLIELLKEERAAVINQAVTRGTNPDAKLKPSGIAWLGHIPEHWEVKKLRYLVSKIGSGITPSGGASVYQQEGVRLLRSQNIHSDKLVLDDVAYISEEVDKSMSNSRINEGDVLLNITGASIGRCYFVPKGFGRGNVNQHVCIIRPLQSSVKTEYLHAVLVSGYGQNLIDMCQTGANREGLNFQQIRGFDIPTCAIDEQQRIVEFIQTATGKIDATVAKIEREIDFVREYRTALISEAVTGKIKVV
jgi:type I restriction enzyme S subunit